MKLFKLRSQIDFEIHVKEVGLRGTRIETENSGNDLAGFDQFKSGYPLNYGEKIIMISRVWCV